MAPDFNTPHFFFILKLALLCKEDRGYLLCIKWAKHWQRITRLGPMSEETMRWPNIVLMLGQRLRRWTTTAMPDRVVRVIFQKTHTLTNLVLMLTQPPQPYLVNFFVYTADTYLQPNVDLTLGQRHRRWPNVKTTLVQVSRLPGFIYADIQMSHLKLLIHKKPPPRGALWWFIRLINSTVSTAHLAGHGAAVVTWLSEAGRTLVTDRSLCLTFCTKQFDGGTNWSVIRSHVSLIIGQNNYTNGDPECFFTLGKTCS